MANNDNIPPNAPAGGGGPGNFTSPLTYGINPATDWWDNPGPICNNQTVESQGKLDLQTRKLAAIAYGEASSLNDADEIGGIAFAVANRARAWGGKTVDQLLTADPHYSYVISDGNPRYSKLLNATEADIEKDKGMKSAVEAAKRALLNVGTDPANGAYWWDGLDFKTNPNHPKRADGFHYSDPSHNIFGVAEISKAVVTHWMVPDKTGKIVEGKERGRYSYIWISTAAHGKTIFWQHGSDYLNASGNKTYK